MPLRVQIAPALLEWAVERSGLGGDTIARRFPKYESWLDGNVKPTLKQLEGFAKATYTPVGYLMLPLPPREDLPIPDLRTVRDARVLHPSADLLDTIYTCQQRQEWYRDFARNHGFDPVDFVGSAELTSSVEETAAEMRNLLGLDLDERSSMSTWSEALRAFIAAADDTGVLVMVSGVVGSNNGRKLDPEEFRGFALSDRFAPLVFINGSDSKSAQMFTLAHELAHLWLGETALSDVGPRTHPTQRVERWCNEVAAELLVPLALIRADFDSTAEVRDEVSRLSRRFKVSTLVVLRRLHDAGHLDRARYWAAYDNELKRLRQLKKGSGGDFYLTQGARLGKRFARSLVVSTLEGQTLHRDAFRLLGFSKVKTFHELGRSLGVM
ncbi:MAG: ImmA/IrrE family metallo-endopeptidase [Myxococcota bacterium]